MRKIFLGAVLLCSTLLFGQVNYTFTSGSGTFTALSGASSFTWTTTTANDEEYSSATNIFDGTETFTYAGTAFTQFQVSTNGFLRFGTGLGAATATDALSGTLRGIVAPLWDDLAVGTTATDVTYQVSGSSGSYVLTVEWKNVKWNKTAGAANAEFQVKIYQATGNIEFIYGTMGTPTTGSASIGLADNTAITLTSNPSTGKFLSLNVGGSSGARVYHQSRGYLFNAINNAPTSSTQFTFTAVTPSAIAGNTYTVGGSSPTYATLSEAAQALNINGISGAVVLDVRDGTYDDIFHLINVAGTSAVNTITLKNESGTVTLTPRNGGGTSATGGAFTSDAIIRLDGTQYTTIQGLTLNDNGLATTALKFEIGIMLGNSVNADATGTMGSGGRNNTFKNLTIDMKCTTGINHSGSIGIRYFTTSSTETDVNKTTSNNTIDNCSITGFWRAGVKTFGISGTNPDLNNTIKNCTLGNISVTTGTGADIRALEMDVQSGLTIENNTIQNIENTINTTNHIYGMWLNPASSATGFNSGTIIIRNNTIKNFDNSGASVTTGFAVGIASNNVATSTDIQVYNNKIYDLYANGSAASRAIGIGLYVSTGTGVTAKVYNNMISDLRCPRSTSAPCVRGLDLQNGGGTGTFNVYHNTINIDDAVPPTNATHHSACIYMASMATGNVDLRNNIFINTMSTASGKAACLMPSTNANFIRITTTSDNNLYYIGTVGTTNGISYDFTTLNQTLGAHQTALSNTRDMNAKSAAVNFSNASSDLHIAGASLGDATNLIASILASPYNVDIDGQTRNASTPYKGADENTGTLLPVELTSFTATAKGKNIELKWTTATETNNLGFDVERAVNGVWTKIGFVQGAGNSNAPKEYAYTDKVNDGGRFSYRLKQIDHDGKFTYNDAIEVVINAAVNNYELAQNFPNPFNPVTTIRFSVKQLEQTSVKVYDVAGREVAELFNGVANPGQVYNVQFNGAGLASGIYFYVLQTPSAREVKKMSLLK